MRVVTSLKVGWQDNKTKGDFVERWHKRFFRELNLVPNPPLMFVQEKLERRHLDLRELWALNLVRPEAEVALRR